MSVYNKSDIDYQKLISLLKNGGVFCYPTETLYGLGCLANNEEAIEKIYKIKQRDKEKNFTLIFKDLDMIEDLCSPTDIQKKQEYFAVLALGSTFVRTWKKRSSRFAT